MRVVKHNAQKKPSGFRVCAPKAYNYDLVSATFDTIQASAPIVFTGTRFKDVTFRRPEFSGGRMSGCTLDSVEFDGGTYTDFDLRGNDLSTIRGGRLPQRRLDRPCPAARTRGGARVGTRSTLSRRGRPMTDDGLRRGWMEGHLDWAAQELGVERVGVPLHTSRSHSVGCRVTDAEGDAWLRVVYDDPEWGSGDYLDRNLAANEIQGVPKPSVKRWSEWEDNSRRMRGEVSTFVADAAISTGMTPTTEPVLSRQWHADLDQALHALAAYPVPDRGVDAGYVNDGIRAFFGIDIDTASVPWSTAHCDLHWGNLTAPRLVILDWETWGKAPAGYDAASLLCATLLYPASAKTLRGALAKYLDTPAGRVATLAAAVRLLRLADGGELTELAIPVRRYGLEIVEQL
jgi:hypothetical protein